MAMYSTSPDIEITPGLMYVGDMGDLAGSIKYNTMTQQMEVFDGVAWIAIAPDSIGLSDDAQNAIDWAKKKHAEEEDLLARMEHNPGLKDAWEKFQIMNNLTAEEDNERK